MPKKQASRTVLVKKVRNRTCAGNHLMHANSGRESQADQKQIPACRPGEGRSGPIDDSAFARACVQQGPGLQPKWQRIAKLIRAWGFRFTLFLGLSSQMQNAMPRRSSLPRTSSVLDFTRRWSIASAAYFINWQLASTADMASSARALLADQQDNGLLNSMPLKFRFACRALEHVNAGTSLPGVVSPRECHFRLRKRVPNRRRGSVGEEIWLKIQPVGACRPGSDDDRVAVQHSVKRLIRARSRKEERLG